ncbi:hypothetical protein ZWY2020_052834 [Hordeum vulgare]|nr:hypothetical protein ZWY2020_052834 [Hordeum vulgare]
MGIRWRWVDLPPRWRVRNSGHIDGTERNRASPQAICKLYKHINEDQRAAIRDMGTGALLDIKCGYLHNTLVTWFTRQYHSGRKGFVVPRRGFIPLTEESVHKILDIPRGDIEIKYEADYDNEDEIASSLFPGDGRRPKITTVVTAIINNNNGDASFKKLWLIYIVSTVLAPTTDTRISNKCYPMLLRYLDALDCNGMELELPDTPYTVNAWSKTHVDVVAEMDMLEHDPPSFGNSQGLTAPATRNTTTSRIKRGTEARESDDTSSEDSVESDNDTNEHNMDIEHDKKKRVTREEDITRGNVESPLTKNVRDVAGEMQNTTYDPSHGANFFGGARETEVCDNTSSGDPSAQFDTKSPSRSTSYLNLPSDSDMCSPDNNSPADTLVSLISEGNGQELEEKIRGSAAGLANRLCELKSTRPADIEQGDGSTHEEIKRIVVKELGLPKETCGQQFEDRNTRKDLRKINARPIKMTPRRKCPESTQEDGEKKRKHAQQARVNVSIKRKSTATLKQPSPKRQATRRSPRLAWITSSNVTDTNVSHAPMEQSSSQKGKQSNRFFGYNTLRKDPNALTRQRWKQQQHTYYNFSKNEPKNATKHSNWRKSSSSSTRISPLGKRISRHMTNDGKSTPIPEHVLNVIKDLSESAKRLGMFQGKKYDSTGAVPKTQAANANKRSHGSSSDKARDNRPGAFTPPSFSLGLSPILSNPSNEVNIDYEHLDAGNPLEIMPLSWAQPTDHVPLIEEMGGKKCQTSPYVLSINNTAQRFEALDSLRTKGNIGLIYHTNVVMRIIKEAQKLYYHKSRVQIENYELEIIDAPKQAVR